MYWSVEYVSVYEQFHGFKKEHNASNERKYYGSCLDMGRVFDISYSVVKEGTTDFSAYGIYKMPRGTDRHNVRRGSVTA